MSTLHSCRSPIETTEEISVSEPAVSFAEQIQVLRRDDHRLYHQSRVNQTLHLISACFFLYTYVLVWFDPPKAAIVAWLGGMCVRQSGHFFFEPQGWDSINGLTNAEKEAIKVGFNVYRKVALLIAWVAIPAVLWLNPSVFGLLPVSASGAAFVDRLGWAWLGLGLAGLLARTVWLMAARSFATGAAWLTKILTDPFHNVHIYWKSPFYLLKGQLVEPLEPVEYYRA
jgi:hypothetical protein